MSVQSSSSSELCVQMTEACRKLGFKVKEVDDGLIIIRYQMHVIHILYYEKAPEDCTVMTAVRDEIPEGERMQVLERCNTLNELLKYFKYYVLGPGVVATVEFQYRDAEDLLFHLQKAVSSVSHAKTIYNRKQ